jgi:hypothetical protein
MALFNFGKKKAKSSTAPAAEPEVLWSKEFTQSGTFKGYRRIKPSRYFHEEIDKSVSYFEEHGYNMKGRTIQLICVRFDRKRPDGCRIDLRVDGMLLGSIWQSDDEQWPMLTEYEFDKVHVRIEDTWPGCTDPRIVHTKVWLFVHYPAEAPIKVRTEVK